MLQFRIVDDQTGLMHRPAVNLYTGFCKQFPFSGTCDSKDQVIDHTGVDIKPVSYPCNQDSWFPPVSGFQRIDLQILFFDLFRSRKPLSPFLPHIEMFFSPGNLDPYHQDHIHDHRHEQKHQKPTGRSNRRKQIPKRKQFRRSDPF